MKNKTKTYILLAAVLGIWGTIAYKIINGIDPGQPEITEQNFDVAFNPEKYTERDSFSITPVNRDPFLGKITSRETAANRAKPSSNSDSNVPTPIFTYNGLIQKQGSRSKIFVVNINNQQHLLKQGQKVNGVTLVRGNKDLVVLRFNGKNITVKL